MKRLSYFLVVGAVALAACGSGSGAVAATVNGENLTVGQIEALLDTDGATVSKDQFAQFLGFQIQWLIAEAAAKTEYGLAPTDDEITAEADRIFNEVSADGETRADFLSSRGFTEQFLRNYARQSLLQTEIGDRYLADTPEPTQEEVDAQRDGSTSVCVSHILVDTEQEAEDVMTRLGDGEDFAALATELSTDTGSAPAGGDLGCGAPSQYVESFAEAVKAAPIGEVYDQIVESTYGFHVIMVSDRTVPTDEEAIQLFKDDAVATQMQDWFLAAVEASDVTVTEEYGTWDSTSLSVVPPAS
ncbi:MAG: peptidylprolyl isomerase [Acidimicrobiia bacterium]